jgi:hypothetical protein
MYMMNTTETATATTEYVVYKDELLYYNVIPDLKMTANAVYQFRQMFNIIENDTVKELDRDIPNYINRLEQYKLETTALQQELRGLNMLNHHNRYKYIKCRLLRLEEMYQQASSYLYNFILKYRDNETELKKLILLRFRETPLYREYLQRGMIETEIEI